MIKEAAEQLATTLGSHSQAMRVQLPGTQRSGTPNPLPSVAAVPAEASLGSLTMPGVQLPTASFPFTLGQIGEVPEAGQHALPGNLADAQHQEQIPGGVHIQAQGGVQPQMQAAPAIQGQMGVQQLLSSFPTGPMTQQLLSFPLQAAPGPLTFTGPLPGRFQ